MEPTATIEAKTTPTKQEGHEEHGANALEKTENEQIEYIQGVVSANNITMDGSFPVEELEPETQALLCPLLNICKEAQEAQIQKLRTHFKNAIANAVGNEAMTWKYEYMTRTVDAVCNKPRHDAMADEAEKSMMALREKYRLEALPFPGLLPL
ncbi:hypothetical protein GGI13_003320 [Coemansia sp. RSA 455]|nr:hypothetical protein GGI13_003320 [Coemansia sp. RSA 455]